VKTLQQLELFAVSIDPYQARVDAALFSSLHSFSDADKRWSKHQKQGLTDAELKEAIAFESLGVHSPPLGALVLLQKY
jgi:hypothetical protein